RDGQPQVWLISPTGGEARRLTDSKTGVRDFAWSPDGKQFAYIATDPDTEEEAKRKKDKADVRVVDRDLKMDHLHLIPASAGSGARRQAADRGRFLRPEFPLAARRQAARLHRGAVAPGQ